MVDKLPSGEAIRAQLLALGHARLQALAKTSGVPFTTLWRIRSGATPNPGIETVRKFLGHVASV